MFNEFFNDKGLTHIFGNIHVLVRSVNLLYVGHSEIKIVPYLCLMMPVKKAYLPGPEFGAVETDWQLLSPVTPFHYKPIHLWVHQDYP